MQRREFLRLLAAGAAAGLALDAPEALAQDATDALYRVPRFGNVSLLHFTDCHAQLLPIYFREPSVNIGVGAAAGRPPHLVGEHLLKAFGIKPGTREAHAFTFLDFERAALAYGKVGGFAHLATLVKRLRAERPGALLLDGGDTWQGSGLALWTKGADMIEAQKLLGVDLMTAHWEFTYGEKRVKEAVEKELGKIEFLAQNVKTTDFGDPVFKASATRTINGVPVAVIGQAFPYTPIANPRHFIPEWTFGIQEEALQKHVDAARGKGAQVVVLLSHNGMDVDLKLAARVRGIDAILGGHTHDGVPQPTLVKNAGGQTLVANSGSNTKFLSVLDLDVKGGKVADFRYRLLPVFANLLPADRRDGRAHPSRARAARDAARREARDDRGPALPPRQLQRHVRPAHPRRDARGERRRDRLLAGLPLGHDHAARGRRSRSSTCSTRRRSRIRNAPSTTSAASGSRKCSRTSATTSSIPTRICSRAATWSASGA